MVSNQIAIWKRYRLIPTETAEMLKSNFEVHDLDKKVVSSTTKASG